MDASGKRSALSLMGVLALAAVLLLTLHGQPAPAAGDAPKYRALLVSGDDEEGHVLDVKHFEEVLKGGTNWAPPNVVETMFAPTPKQLTDKIKAFFDGALDSDISLFLFSDHGNKKSVDKDGDEPVGFPDGDAFKRCGVGDPECDEDISTGTGAGRGPILDDNFDEPFKDKDINIKPQKVVILESCHSGGMKDGKKDITKDPPVGKVIVLASSGTNQVSFGSKRPTPDHNHGDFVQTLIAGLANNGKGYARADNLFNLQNEPRPGARDGKVTVKEWFDYQMARGLYSPGQTPEIIDSQEANTDKAGQNVVIFEYDKPGQANNLKEHEEESKAAPGQDKPQCDPDGVGGTVVLNGTESNSQAANAGLSGFSSAEVVPAAAGTVVFLTIAGWYVRRRRLRQSRD